jgi:hypothetical protein
MFDDTPYTNTVDTKKPTEPLKSVTASRLPIRNVLDVFQELKLAFGRN